MVTVQGTLHYKFTYSSTLNYITFLGNGMYHIFTTLYQLTNIYSNYMGYHAGLA